MNEGRNWGLLTYWLRFIGTVGWMTILGMEVLLLTMAFNFHTDSVIIDDGVGLGDIAFWHKLGKVLEH